MTITKLLRSELTPVLAGVVDHGNRHLAEIESDLAQTNFLLVQAIQKLSAGFMAIHTSICQQQEIIESSLIAHIPPENAARLQTIFQEVGLHVNATITGLQFQDMTSQLIDRALQQVNSLRTTLEILNAVNAGLTESTEEEESVIAINKLSHRLDQQHEQFDNEQTKTVCQTHMESGEIDLF